jgi:hypothetical protein
MVYQKNNETDRKSVFPTSWFLFAKQEIEKTIFSEIPNIRKNPQGSSPR